MSYAHAHKHSRPAKDQSPYCTYASSDSCEMQHDQSSSPESFQSRPTLCNPMDRSLQGSMKFSRQEYWRGFPCLPPGDLPNPGIKSSSLNVSCIDRWVLYHQRHLGSPDQYEDLGKLIKVATDHHLLSSTVSFMFSVAYNNILSKSYFLTYSGNGTLF